MGKVEIGIYFCVTADILTKVLQQCSWSSLLLTLWILSKLLILIGCHGNRKAKFSRKKYSKIFFSEAIRGMKLKLCINVHDISLYIIIFILSLPMCFRCYGNFHRLIMVKVEIGIYFCVTADILTKVLLIRFWSSPLPTIWILSKSLILIDGYGKRNAKFSREKKNIQKFSSQKP